VDDLELRRAVRGAQDATTDSTEAIDGDAESHGTHLWEGAGLNPAEALAPGGIAA
jgi:hypothetical protein